MNGPICLDADCYRFGEEMIQRAIRDRSGEIVIVRAHRNQNRSAARSAPSRP